jgi:hypothetical protein
VQSGVETVSVALGGAEVRLAPYSSAVVEKAPTGLTLAVRSGGGVFVARGVTLAVRRGEIAQAAGRARVPPTVVAGGRALWDLVVRESRTALGDVGRVEAFLIDRALGREPIAAESGDTAFDLDVDRGGRLVEGAVRPPPFFEDEVPPKGPNVRVDVAFTEE